MKTVQRYAVIITVILFAGAVLFTGCPQSIGGGGSSNPPAEQVTLTIRKGANVKSVTPATLTVAKGTAWSAVKDKITVTYDDGYEAAGWKLASAGGADIVDGTVFTENTTVFAVSKAKTVVPPAEQVTLTIRKGANVKSVTPATLTVAKGTVWSAVKDKITVTYDDGYEAAGWKLASAGGADIVDGTVFTENTTVFAVSKAKPVVPPANPVRLIIRGDERIDEVKSGFMVVEKNKTWAEVKVETAAKVFLKSGWSTGDYGVYEWHLTDENGTLITDTTVFTADTVVYAVTNYIKFNIGGAEIKGYTGEKPRGKIIIPAKNGPTDITDIAQSAFSSCTGLTSLTLPSSLTTIGYEAFKSCTTLTGDLDLSGCTQLTTIGNGAFYSCSLESLTLPLNLTTIGEETFMFCTDLKSLTLPSNLTTIGERAFEGCRGLKSLTLPSSLTTIGKRGFYNCKGLKGSLALSGCTQLTTIGEEAFYDCTGLKDLTLPSSLTTIGEKVFSGCSGLTSLTLPSSLTTIGKSAFSGCTGLTSLTLPSSLRTIGDNAFSGCTGLKDVLGLSGCTQLTTIGNGAFQSCWSLTGDLNLSDCTQLTTIGKSAFYGCGDLTSLTLASSLTTIGEEAFSSCRGLKGTVNFPAHLKEIGRKAFSMCREVNNFDFLPCTQLELIGNSAFKYCGISAKYKIKSGSSIRDLLLSSGNGITPSQIIEVP